MADVVIRWKWKKPRTSREWKRAMHLPGLVDAMQGYADAIKATAESTAPVDTGEYRDSFVTAVAEGSDGKRAAVVIGNTAPHSRFVEFGADRTPAYHTLEAAATSHGVGTIKAGGE